MVYLKCEGNPWEFKHALVIDKWKIVRKTCEKKRKITLLKDVKVWKPFEENITKLVDVGATDLWGHFKDGFI